MNISRGDQKRRNDIDALRIFATFTLFIFHTGMIFNPVNPTEFVVSVQHPDSTRLSQVPDGFGDALWTFDLTNVVPPPCEGKKSKGKSKRKSKRKSKGKGPQTCTDTDDFTFVEMLEKTGK